mmetsp:Transcript_3955/g.3548  ORF Transcript_3955/g.3548 Transcript_3955/m.3548 type:complete len:176 (-) Transcript_3955:90-617(-)
MFYMARLRKDIQLEPFYLGKQMRGQVRRKLIEELEGQCLGKYGFVIFILDIDDNDILPGLIENDTGSCNVIVWYTAVFLKPFKHQVLDAIVYAVDELGFFCRVGPLQIFVSRFCLPNYLVYDTTSCDSWISSDRSVDIRIDKVVRIRIIGVSPLEAGQMTATATIKDLFLGELDR